MICRNKTIIKRKTENKYRKHKDREIDNGSVEKGVVKGSDYKFGIQE